MKAFFVPGFPNELKKAHEFRRLRNPGEIRKAIAGGMSVKFFDTPDGESPPLDRLLVRAASEFHASSTG